MTGSFVKRIFSLALPLLLYSWPAFAQQGDDFPAMPVSAKVLNIHNQAEAIYQRAEYERAFFIYSNELAPIGDKYGQYMVGYMHLAGKGVPEDRALASAWYRLAAERGGKEFIAVRDALMAILDDAQTARSDELFVELRRQYGDLALLLQAARKEQKVLKGRTGSRGLSAGASSVIVIRGAGGKTLSGADYYRQVERRMQARLDYIQRHAKIDIDDSNLAALDLDAVESQVDEYLSQPD